MKTKIQLTPRVTPKTKLKRTLVYTSAGVALAFIIGIGAFFYFNIGDVEDAYAANYSSVQSGAWTAGSTWSGGNAPPVSNINGDNITINSGDSVTRSGNLNVKNNTTFIINSNADLVIDGDLVVQNNLVLNVNGDLVVTGDVITQNGASITINGGGNAEIMGNASFGNNTDFTVDGVLQVGGSVSFGSNSTFDGGGMVTVDGNGCDEWSGSGSCTDNTTLPVELLSFYAESSGEEVVVTWETATELNNDYFNIQRSTDGKTFKNIAEIKGNGTTNNVSSYSYVDENPLNGMAYYRLKQTDFDGTTEIFRPVMVEMSLTTNEIDVYPNPLMGNNLNIKRTVAEDGWVNIFDQSGNNVFSRQVNGFDNVVALNINQGLQPGLYYVKYKSGSTEKTIKLIKR